MNKKILLTVLLITPLLAEAEEISPFPIETRGIQIIPLENMNLPKEIKQNILIKTSEEKSKGYNENNDNKEYINFLFNLRNNATKEISEYSFTNNPYDTHLKNSPKDIKLNFPFQKISFIKKDEIIGYAPIGSYVDNKGWSGIKAFFNFSKLGTCAYSITSIKAAQLSKETTEYFINNKPSNKIIEGSYDSGFMYSINWYTNSSMSIFECANTKFDKKIMDKMIILANKIDRIE